MKNSLRNSLTRSTCAFARAMKEGPGFSVTYAGKALVVGSPADWQEAAADDAASGASRTVFTHADGLTVTRESWVRPERNAIEYRLSLKNTSQRALPAITQIESLRLEFDESVMNGNCVVSGGGGLFEMVLPPSTFAIKKRCFSEMLDEYSRDDPVVVGGESGRSSNKDMPFFFIQNAARKAGLFVAFGWSGQWTAAIAVDPVDSVLRLTGRIPGMDIELAPGEEIQGPSIVVGFYEGDFIDGVNQLRRLITQTYTPKLDGKEFIPVATYDTYFGGIGAKIDDPLLRRLADAAATIGQEYFLVDLGWFAPAEKVWGRGNWYEPDRAKFPQGLGPVADYIRSKGLKFGLWFETETVDRGSRLALDHPDWVLWDYQKDSSARPDYLAAYGTRGLLDHGRPEVQKWICDMFDHNIREYGIEYLRYDFNTDPLVYWDANDQPGRRGIKQLRHIQGVYAVLDWLRQRHPNVVLEGCAGGGRRIDLEVLKRFHTLWISDYTVDPAIIRFQLFGANHFLPGNYNYMQYVLPTIHQKEFRADDLGFQSFFGGAFGTGGRVDLWPPQMKEQAALHVARYKEIRRHLTRDFYPLSPQPADLESWSGWQFHNPEEQTGFVQAFRTRTEDASHQFMLRGLDAATSYHFVDLYGGQSFDLSGAEAMKGGVRFEQAPMSSKILTYSAVRRA